MKNIYLARDTMEAHFLKGLLDREGIESVVEGEAVTSGFGILPENRPTVWVKDQDEPRAAVIVDELKRRDRAEGEPWKCPNCGEEVEGQFSQCWHCGANRPAAEGSDSE